MKVLTMILMIFLLFTATALGGEEEDQQEIIRQLKQAYSLSKDFTDREIRSEFVSKIVDACVQDFGKITFLNALTFLGASGDPAGVIARPQTEPLKSKIRKLWEDCAQEENEPMRFLVCTKRSLEPACTACLDVKFMCRTETIEDLCPDDSSHKIFRSYQKAKDWSKLNCTCK